MLRVEAFMCHSVALSSLSAERENVVRPRATPKGPTQQGVVGRTDDDSEEEEDSFLDLDIDEDEIDGHDAEDVVGALGLGEDDQAPGTSTGGTFWGEAGLRAAEKV
jgi:isoaspartyl peptidase/L-asparaginase-like protein (Ntn-hydrolase superfamily)